MRKIKIGIAEDHDVVRQGLVSLFKEENNIKVLFDVRNGVELVDCMKRNSKPDVVILDVEMPVLDGRRSLEILVEKYPYTKFLMLSMHTSLDYIHECIALGAHGFLSKESDFEQILDAVQTVAKKGFYFNDIVSKALVAASHASTSNNNIEEANMLDPVDLQIIELICMGKTNGEISEEIHLSTRTIEGRRLRISKKTETANLVQLVVYAIKNGIYKI